MNKSELVSRVAEESGVAKKTVEDVLSCCFSVVEAVLVSGEDISISGFGKWEVVERKGRKGRNPKTGEELQIPAKKTAKWSPSKVIKNTLNA